MAKNKTGFAYYNIDTDRYQDKRIKKLKRDLGCTGICVYDWLLCEIYRVEGCFLMWDENTAFDVADYFGLKESLVNEIVNYCCSVGLFNKELLASERVLSSRSIQARFTEMSKRAKRDVVKIPEKYEIIPEEYQRSSGIKVDSSGSLTQSRVKKSKEEESITHTQEELAFFKNFEKWILGNTPDVAKMKEPFTIDQYLKLKEDFKTDKIMDMLKKMHNYKPLLKRNNSANLTFRNWVKKDEPIHQEKVVNI